MATNEGIPMTKFLHIVGELKFRGTSVLFRLPRCPVVKGRKTKSELAPGSADDGAAPEQMMQSPKPPTGKKISNGEREKCDEEMEISDGVGGGGREEVAGERGEVVPDETLPRVPAVRVQDEEGKEKVAAKLLSGLEGEFTIATHFVKVSYM